MVLDILRRPKPQNFLVKRKEKIIQKEKKKEIATSVFAPGNITHNHNIFKDIHTYIFLFYESFGLNFIFLFIFHVFCLWPEKKDMSCTKPNSVCVPRDLFHATNVC